MYATTSSRGGIGFTSSMGATGLEPDKASHKEIVGVIQSNRHVQNEQSLLQARLRAVYNQDVTTGIEKDLIGIASQWNKLESTSKGDNDRLREAETVHTIRKSVTWEDGRQTGRISSDSFQDRLHGLYSHDTANKETEFMKLAKEWNKTDAQDNVSDSIKQNETIYVLGEGNDIVTKRVSRSETGAELVARVRGRYGQTSGPSTEDNNMLPPKAWNKAEPTLGITVAVIGGNKVLKEERRII